MFSITCLLTMLTLGTAFASDPSHRITCADIESQRDFSISALGGNWVALESVHYQNGHPNIPSDDTRPNTCLYYKDSEASESGMKIKIDFHEPGKELVTETSTLTLVGEDKGRFSVQSQVKNRDNWQFLILDSDPAKFLVYALCLPPNAAGERLPLRINLLSRPTVTTDEQLKLENKIGGKLRLTGSGVSPVKYSDACWASYVI